MFCKNCGTQMADNAAFCPNCGTASGTGVNLGAVSTENPATMSTYTVESVAGQKSFLQKYWGFFAAGAAVVAIGVGVGVFYFNNLQSGPVVSFMQAVDNLNNDSKDIQSGVMTIEVDGLCDAQMQFSVDPKAQTMYMYGDVSMDTGDLDMDMEMAICIEGSDAYMCAEYEGDYQVVDLGDYADLDEIWESYEKEPEEIDWQETIEDADVDRYLEEYIDVDQINDIVKKFGESMRSGDNRERIEQAMQITVTEAGGVKTYTSVVTAQVIVDTAGVFVDLFEEAAGDAIEGDWLDDVRDTLEEAREEAEDEDFLEEEMFDFSYGIKNDRFTNVTLSSGDLLADEVDSRVEMVVDFLYDGKKLSGFEMAVDMDVDYEEISMVVSLTELNAVDDVKGAIPEEMLEEMNMD